MLRRLLALFALTLTVSLATAQAPDDVQAIRSAITKSADDWNRGDLEAFVESYKNSPDILFMGHIIHRGRADLLATYRTGFPTKGLMGVLTFTDLEVQPLDAQFATVTGRYHLERTKKNHGNKGGYFLLVLEKTPVGWKIIRDDTTDDTKK